MAASPNTQHFLKLEDLRSSPPSGPESPAFEQQSQLDMMQATPPPVVITSKPAKKRKSWGQELPDPITTLPPRKRAKTDDEKEQRRIERIKRNRAAAHNSRERKRQETETLAVALARANAELDAYRRLHGPLPASVVLPEVTICTEGADTPVPSLSESRGTAETAPSPESPPHDDIFDISHIKEEPHDSPMNIPTPFVSLDEKPAVPSLDQTQHSAAMLCDLPCRSRAAQTTPASASANSFWASLFFHLTMLQLQATYKTLLLGLWSLSPLRMERWMHASMHRSTSRLMTSSTTTTPLLWRSTVLAQRNAATPRRSPQGALVALQRSSMDDGRQKEDSTGVAWRDTVRLQRKALEEQREGKSDFDDDKTADGDGGV